MGKAIVNLSNKKCKNNNKSTGHLNQIHKSLLMSIVNTPEKYVSNICKKHIIENTYIIDKVIINIIFLFDT